MRRSPPSGKAPASRNLTCFDEYYCHRDLWPIALYMEKTKDASRAKFPPTATVLKNPIDIRPGVAPILYKTRARRLQETRLLEDDNITILILSHHIPQSLPARSYH